MNVKGNLMSKLCAILAIISLLVSNFLFVGTNLVSYALDAVTTSSANVEFTAYFFDSNQVKTDKIQKSIDEGDIKLYVDISVKKEGYFNGQITLNNSNFDLKQETNNQHIKNISGNTVTLNQINAGSIVTIELGIQPKNTEFILNSKTDIGISGSYVNSKNVEKNNYIDVQGTTAVEVEWKSSSNTQAELDTSLITNSLYKVNGEEKRVLQILVNSKITENNYPVKNTEVTLNVPENVKKVEVHARSTEATNKNTTFSENNYTYNEQNKTLTINLSNEDKNNISWNKNVQDTFVITYEFDKTENILNKDVTINSRINTYDNKTLKATKNVHIDKEIDGIVSSIIESSEEAIYKGKIYTGAERDYTQKSTINIDYLNDTQNITIKANEATYVTNTTENAANIIYKQTKINKQEFTKIFGQEGYLTIKNNNKVIGNINNNTQADENGNIYINYTNNIKNIEITTSKPVAIGTLNIENTKAILNAGYSREEINNFTEIKDSISVNNTQTTKTITLKDTETSANIKIKNLSKISTLADSQTLELEAILDTTDESKDLYKNPSITIILPKEITIISSKYNVLYSNGLEVEKASTTKNANQESQVEIKFKGEQQKYDSTGGTVINLNLNIKTDKLTPTKSSSIQIKYTNENKNQEKTAYAEFDFESQYGLMLYNKMSNYNNEKESITTIDSNERVGTIDANTNAKEIALGTAIINNYGETVQNVALIGTIPSVNNEDTYKATLNKIEVDKEGAKVYYSSNINIEANDKTWGEYTKDAVSYKIELPEMAKEEAVKIKVTVTLPENIGYNKKGIFTTKTSCNYKGQEQVNSSNIALATKVNIAVASEEIATSKNDENGLNTKISAMIGNGSLTENDNIYEGQTIRYKVTVTNNTGKDYSNVTVKASQKNGYVWDNVETEVINPHYNSTSNKEYYKITDSNNIQLGEIDSFKNGESYTFEYEASAYLLDNKKIDGNETYGVISVISKDKQLNETETTIKNKIKEGELQVNLIQGSSKELELTSGGEVKAQLAIKNTTNETLKNIEVKTAFSNGLIANVSINDENSTKISYKEQEEREDGISIITLNISSIEANETVNIELYPYTQDYLNSEKVDIWMLAQATTQNENSYISNKLTRTVYDNSNNIKVEQQGVYQDGTNIDTDQAKLNNGDQIKLLATISNNDNKELNVNIEYNLDKMIDIQSAKIINETGEEDDVTEQISYNNVRQNEQKIEPGETITIETIGTIDALEIDSVTNKLNIYDNENGKSVNNNLSISVNTLHEQIEEPEEDEEEPNIDEEEPQNSQGEQNPQTSNENANNSNDNTNNTNTNTKTDNNVENTDKNDNTETNKKTYAISGTAWLDKDKDGKKNSEEEKISNITIEAINLEKGKVLASTKTDANGEYKLALEQGKYILLYNYDNNLYTTTTYKISEATTEENSDVIERNVTFNGTTKKAGITDTIDLNSNITDLDIGLVLRSTFDLKLQKYVSKITVTNDTGTNTYEQPDNTTLAKAEIKAKNLSGSLVVIEYKIKITNVGDVAGYANQIVDYMPSSLNFNSSINSDWYKSGENLYNTSLANTKIEPGESKELTLVLTKTMTESNTGLINNKAAINESSNLLGISDETMDAGSADVIISVKTGALVSYVASTLTTFIIVACIAYIINKKYLSKRI